jgi:hypothetical protein
MANNVGNGYAVEAEVEAGVSDLAVTVAYYFIVVAMKPCSGLAERMREQELGIEAR